MTIRENDKIIFLATDRNELVYHMNDLTIKESDDYTCGKHYEARESNRILVLGYDEAFDSTVINLKDHYLKSAAGPNDINCYIKLVYRNKREARVRAARLRFLDSSLSKSMRAVELDQSHGIDSTMKKIKDIRLGTTQISFHCARQNHFDLGILESILLSGELFDHIVVLSDLSASKEDADTDTLLTLLYLRAISENVKKGVYTGVELPSINITSEIQNMENINLAYNEYVSDYIISWKFIASLQVQIAADNNLFVLLRSILKSDLVDIRLEPITRFVKPELFECLESSDADSESSNAGFEPGLKAGVDVDLDIIAHVMRSIDDFSERRLLLGYMRKAGDYVLNPRRGEDGRRIAHLHQSDYLIILANN